MSHLLRGASLELWCHVLMPQIPKTLTAVVRAKGQGAAGPDLQRQLVAFRQESRSPTQQLELSLRSLKNDFSMVVPVA